MTKKCIKSFLIDHSSSVICISQKTFTCLSDNLRTKFTILYRTLLSLHADFPPPKYYAIKFQPDSYSLPENLNLSSRLEIIGIWRYFAFEPEDITHKKNNKIAL